MNTVGNEKGCGRMAKVAVVLVSLACLLFLAMLTEAQFLSTDMVPGSSGIGRLPLSVSGGATVIF